MDVLTVREAAEMLKCTPQTLWAKIRAGEVPHFRIGKGGAIRFDRQVLYEWARNQMLGDNGAGKKGKKEN